MTFDGQTYRLGPIPRGGTCPRCHRGPFKGRGLTFVNPNTGQGLCHECVRDLVSTFEWSWMSQGLTPAHVL